MQKPAFAGKLLVDRKVAEDTRNNALKYYATQKWDLVPVRRNGKEPFEMDWPKVPHTDIVEWYKWLDMGLNFGVKTGKISGILILDFDSDEVPEPFKTLLKDYKGFMQRTKRGWHFAFKYDPEIPNSNFDFNGCHVDIRSDGGQVVLYPSIIDGQTNGSARKILCMDDIPVMLPEIKQELLKIGLVHVQPKPEEFTPEPIDFSTVEKIDAGNRNNFLIHFGGIIRSKMSADQTKTVLSVVNQKFLNPPVNQAELQHIMTNLAKYVRFEEKDLADRILAYLRIVREASARDVKEVMNESKEKVDKALAWLLKESIITKRHTTFHFINKPDWKDTWNPTPNRVNFKVPYFEDFAYFNWQDLVLVGSKTKFGKSHIAINMIKQLHDQGRKAYYMSSESGSRFQQIAVDLGLGQGDFFWSNVPDPTKVELEPGAITIIDWLMIEDFAMTDKVIKYFVNQLIKTNGFLIIFMQLREDNGNWFAANLAKQFPSFAARYLYDDETGQYGTWHVDAIREPRGYHKSPKIPCIYNRDTKILSINPMVNGNGQP